MNPLGGSSYNNNKMQMIFNNIRFARQFESPQAFMDALQRNNPQMAQQIMQLQQTVRNPMQYAAEMMRQHGIDPQQFLAMLSNPPRR